MADVAFVTVTVNMAGIEYSESRAVGRPARNYSDVKASVDTAFSALFSRFSRAAQGTRSMRRATMLCLALSDHRAAAGISITAQRLAMEAK